MRSLDVLTDAVREGSGDPESTDIYIRLSAAQLNGTQSLAKIPVGELWIIDYITASTNAWTLRTQAYPILFGAQPVVLASAPVLLPGDELSLVTTSATDWFGQVTRRPVPDIVPRRTATGGGKENVSGFGGNPQHEEHPVLLMPGGSNGHSTAR
jgi:hypothetical protein